MQFADAVLLAVEVSAIGVCCVADGFNQSAVFGHVDVVGKSCIPVCFAELVDHAGEPVDLTCIAEHVETVFEGCVFGIAFSAVDAEAVFVFVGRYFSAG